MLSHLIPHVLNADLFTQFLNNYPARKFNTIGTQLQLSKPEISFSFAVYQSQYAELRITELAKSKKLVRASNVCEKRGGIT